MPAATEKLPEPVKKNPFKVAEGKASILLLPTESYERSLVEDALLEQGYKIDDLPKVAKDYEIRTHKLASKHVIFTAVCVATAIGLKKRPEKYKLVISPPIDCAKYANSSEDDEFGEVDSAALVDALQKHVVPMVIKLNQEGCVRIMGL
jgi:hypothetical protein